jgi:hypothetical protein
LLRSNSLKFQPLDINPLDVHPDIIYRWPYRMGNPQHHEKMSVSVHMFFTVFPSGTWKLDSHFGICVGNFAHRDQPPLALVRGRLPNPSPMLGFCQIPNLLRVGRGNSRTWDSCLSFWGGVSATLLFIYKFSFFLFWRSYRYVKCEVMPLILGILSRMCCRPARRSSVFRHGSLMGILEYVLYL